MQNYKQHIILLIKRIVLILILFSGTRILFHIFNHDYFQIEGLKDLLSIYFYGIKFDIFVVATVNVPFVLVTLFPGKFKDANVSQKIFKFYFVIVNGLLLTFNFIDIKYFDFTNKRSTNDLFELMSTSDDLWQIIPLFLKDFWYLLLLWALFIFAFWRLYSMTKFKRLESHTKLSLKQFIQQSLILIGILFLTGVGARGSFGIKPLRTIDAAQYTSSQNIALVLNTPFTIIKSLNKKELEIVNYFPENELDKIFNPVRKFSADSAFNKMNVVIIIMESFANEYIGAFNGGNGYTPFLDSLIQQSLVFPNAFANGKKSIEAVPSILVGIPSLMDNPYLTSSYSTNQVRSIASILKQEGYHSSFFHGGKNGTMGFDKFLNYIGFDAYYGLNEYPDKESFDGGWGIYDEPFFTFFADELNEINKPFISCFFSLSSHHPYHIPKNLRNKFPKGDLNIHESVGYADFALSKFFEQAQKYEWYQNTLFIITADHTAQLTQPKYKNTVGNYNVPILFFSPNHISPEIDSTLVQQIDIIPSILDFLNYSGTEILFGESVFAKKYPHTINFKSGVYQLIDSNYLLKFNGTDVIGLYNYKKDLKQSKNLMIEQIDRKEELESYLKAYIQVFNGRVINNQLIYNE